MPDCSRHLQPYALPQRATLHPRVARAAGMPISVFVPADARCVPVLMRVFLARNRAETKHADAYVVRRCGCDNAPHDCLEASSKPSLHKGQSGHECVVFKL